MDSDLIYQLLAALLSKYLYLPLKNPYWLTTCLRSYHCSGNKLVYGSKPGTGQRHFGRKTNIFIHHTERSSKCPVSILGRVVGYFKNGKSNKQISLLVEWCHTHRHGTHLPQIQIRLVMNLYLGPAHHSGNVIWARNVYPTFYRPVCPALPCLATTSGSFLSLSLSLFAHVHEPAFNQLYQSQSLDHLLDFCTLKHQHF